MFDTSLTRFLDNRVVPQLPLIIFELNETLLDSEAMVPVFEKIFGERLAMRLWYDDLIIYSEALTLANIYVPLTEICTAALKKLADTRGVKLTEADKMEVMEKFASMPPHREVPRALRKLRAAGFRLFTLSNNRLDTQSKQLDRGGIIDLFERCFSADGAKHHKPALEAYAYVERELGVQPADLLLMTCHAWDSLGAKAAGWGSALIKRPGNNVLDVGPQPDFVGRDVDQIADELMKSAHIFP